MKRINSEFFLHDGRTIKVITMLLRSNYDDRYCDVVNQ